MAAVLNRNGRPQLASGRPLLSSGTGGGGGGGGGVMTLIDYVTSFSGIQPVVQRKAGQTYADVPVLYSFASTPPSQPQARVISSAGGAEIVTWTNLTGVTTAGLTGEGRLPGVPQGINYLLQVRNGPSGTPSNGATPFGVGVIAIFEGQSNASTTLSGDYNAPVPGQSLTEYYYYVSKIGTGITGSFFDDQGWHAVAGPGYGPWGSSSAPAAQGNPILFTRLLMAALKAKYGVDVPVGLVPWAFNGQTIGSFSPFTTARLAANSGVSAGTFGLYSPRNIFCQDFEFLLWCQGEADATGGSAGTAYTAALRDFYASALTYVAPAGRAAATLNFLPVILGNYDPATLPFADAIRQSLAAFPALARAGTLPSQPAVWPLVNAAGVYLDLPRTDGLHIGPAAVQMRAMKRVTQAVLKGLGASTFGADGPKLGTPSRASLVVTIPVTHDGGTALVLPSPGSPATGFSANTLADFSGTAITVSAALSGGAVQVTFPGGTTFPAYLRYGSGANPDMSNPVYDNAVYPAGATGSDIEARGLPMGPTVGSITIT